MRRQAAILQLSPGTRVHTLLRDIHYGMRSLLNSPGPTMVAIMALTLGKA